eukprot:m51a1_g10970 hypothetical protein (132) ;mRNA; f:266640-267335
MFRGSYDSFVGGSSVAFRMHYWTKYGQSLRVTGSYVSNGQTIAWGLPMTWTRGHMWTAKLSMPAGATGLEYRYWVCEAGNNVRAEGGVRHVAVPPPETKCLELEDQWDRMRDEGDTGAHERSSPLSAPDSA